MKMQAYTIRPAADPRSAPGCYDVLVYRPIRDPACERFHWRFVELVAVAPGTPPAVLDRLRRDAVYAPDAAAGSPLSDAQVVRMTAAADAGAAWERLHERCTENPGNFI